MLGFKFNLLKKSPPLKKNVAYFGGCPLCSEILNEYSFLHFSGLVNRKSEFFGVVNMS